MSSDAKGPAGAGPYSARCGAYFLSLVGAWAGLLLSLVPLVPATGAVVMPVGAFAAGAGVPGVVASFVPPGGLAAGPVGFWSAPLPIRSGFTSEPAPPPPAPSPAPCAIANVELAAINAADNIVVTDFMSPSLRSFSS